MAAADAGSPPDLEEPSSTPPGRSGRSFSRPGRNRSRPRPTIMTHGRPGHANPAVQIRPGGDFLEPDDAEPAISEEAYLSATTAEYRDLAEEIARGGHDDPAKSRRWRRRWPGSVPGWSTSPTSPGRPGTVGGRCRAGRAGCCFRSDPSGHFGPRARWACSWQRCCWAAGGSPSSSEL